MPTTYEPLSLITVNNATTSVEFSNISQNYTDLQVVVSGVTNPVYEVQIKINNDSSALYSRVYVAGDGSSVSSAVNAGGGSWLGAWVATGVTGQTAIHDFFNYSETTSFKTMLNKYSTNNGVEAAVMLYRSTSAITSLTYFVTTSTINVGSTFALYGILKA